MGSVFGGEVCVGRYDFELLGHDTPFGPEARYKMGELAE